MLQFSILFFDYWVECQKSERASEKGITMKKVFMQALLTFPILNFHFTWFSIFFVICVRACVRVVVVSFRDWEFFTYQCDRDVRLKMLSVWYVFVFFLVSQLVLHSVWNDAFFKILGKMVTHHSTHFAVKYLSYHGIWLRPLYLRISFLLFLMMIFFLSLLISPTLNASSSFSSSI